MKTIALRYGEHFSPECGTIAAHQEVIDKLGYVWYGKMGNPVSGKVVEDILKQDIPKILLIQSGRFDRFWAHVIEITKETPPLTGVPAYYRDQADKFKTWFKVTEFERAERGVMSQCKVASSGNLLSNVSRHSMSPYFIIEYKDGDE